MKLGKVDYGSMLPPAGYRCVNCGAHSVKLWRDVRACADQVVLLCCECAAASQRKDPAWVGRDGMIAEPDGTGTDQIGALLPAVPDEDGRSFWCYTCVPQEAVEWWRRLPTHKVKDEPLGSDLDEAKRIIRSLRGDLAEAEQKMRGWEAAERVMRVQSSGFEKLWGEAERESIAQRKHIKELVALLEELWSWAGCEHSGAASDELRAKYKAALRLKDGGR